MSLKPHGTINKSHRELPSNTYFSHYENESCNTDAEVDQTRGEESIRGRQHRKGVWRKIPRPRRHGVREFQKRSNDHGLTQTTAHQKWNDSPDQVVRVDLTERNEPH